MDCITTLLVFDYPEFQEFLLNDLQVKTLAWSQLAQK